VIGRGDSGTFYCRGLCLCRMAFGRFNHRNRRQHGFALNRAAALAACLYSFRIICRRATPRNLPPLKKKRRSLWCTFLPCSFAALPSKTFTWKTRLNSRRKLAWRLPSVLRWLQQPSLGPLLPARGGRAGVRGRAGKAGDYDERRTQTYLCVRRGVCFRHGGTCAWRSCRACA